VNGRRSASNRRFAALTVCAIGLAPLFSSCVGWGDVAVPTKAIVAGYRLELFEGSSYYLCQPNGHCGGMSAEPLDGRVKQLGWNASTLVLLMTGPAPDGWHIVDLKTKGVRGPLTDEAFRALKGTDPSVASIRIRSVEEVWP
jgi:hypothetical protein